MIKGNTRVISTKIGIAQYALQNLMIDSKTVSVD
jgi:hypothetical protein